MRFITIYGLVFWDKWNLYGEEKYFGVIFR